MLLIIIVLITLAILLRPVYHEPKVFKKLITSEECDHIVGEASESLTPSTVSVNGVMDINVRKSDTAWLSTDDPVILSVIEKCVSKTDRNIKNCEKLQVLKYTPGGFYKPHQDCLENDKNQRMYTCIIALTDDYEGGATVFPNLNKKYKMSKGDVLFFNTLNDWGYITPRALHGGEPVTKGEKWICNVWVRTFPY